MKSPDVLSPPAVRAARAGGAETDIQPGEARLVNALRSAGVRGGDILFTHVSLHWLNAGLAEEEDDARSDARNELLLSALRTAVGSTGTIIVPSYTFSFCSGEVFDPASSPAARGPWSRSTSFLEYFRSRPGVIRSRDPIHSVAACGPQASALLDGLPATCFGAGSVHDRLLQQGGRICLLGAPLGEATFRHHVEEMLGVPYRFQKLFTGFIREGDSLRKLAWLYYVRILAENATPDTATLETLADREGLCGMATFGDGAIADTVRSVDAAEYRELLLDLLRKDRWMTARGPAEDPVRLESERTGAVAPEVELRASASMNEMVAALWHLRRDIVSDGYDAALQALAGQLPMTVHKYRTGSECFTWIVPEKWTCHEAWLETLDGRRLFSYADNPLHVVSYSLPFEGVVSRETLLRHLHVHPRLRDAVPFVFKYYERDWGLCCSQSVRESLTDEEYRVVIRSDFSLGELKVGEIVVPGNTDECIVLCAHLCHPAMVNDDLTGVVVGMDVMRALLQKPKPRYTYRFLIVPETIGSVAYLSRNPRVIERCRGGLFLEMLGRSYPHALQYSWSGLSEVDECFALALAERDPLGWTTRFRSLAGNDERQFNAPGIRVPMLQLCRQLPPDHPEHPYREYHSSEDTPAHVPAGSLEQSRDLVLAMIDTLERNAFPVNRYRGEPFCSRYGLQGDSRGDARAYRALFDLLFEIDGSASLANLAARLRVPFSVVCATVDELGRHGLVELSRHRAVPTRIDSETST